MDERIDDDGISEYEMAEQAAARLLIAQMEERARKLDAIQPYPFRQLCLVFRAGDRAAACFHARVLEEQREQIELNDRVIAKQRSDRAELEVKCDLLEARVSAAKAQLGLAGRKPH